MKQQFNKKPAKVFKKPRTRFENLVYGYLPSDMKSEAIRNQYFHVSEDEFFYPDFLFGEAKIIIEIDGESHINKENTDRDRDQLLRERGYDVLRFQNEETCNCIFFLYRLQYELRKLQNENSPKKLNAYIDDIQQVLDNKVGNGPIDIEEYRLAGLSMYEAFLSYDHCLR